jgi:hypothetical protein
MAKATVKKAAPAKKVSSTGSKAKSSGATIDKVCEQALEKLQALNIEHQLQADLVWCLGSYRHDQNPVGLFQNGAKALEAFNAANAKKAKSVPAKLITDLQKALKQN